MERHKATQATARWDAGDAGCSRLIIGVRRELERVAPGQILEVTASDAGARLDLWVWCRMTGNCLETEAHPIYVIRRKPANDERTRY
jgi:tRNA 2-thiouridine synthesizing protein A